MEQEAQNSLARSANWKLHKLPCSKDGNSGGGNVHEPGEISKLPHAFSSTVVGVLQKQQNKTKQSKKNPHLCKSKLSRQGWETSWTVDQLGLFAGLPGRCGVQIHMDAG